MSKPMIGVVTGALLGALDGLSAWFSPDARPIFVMIVLGSTIKGVVTGLLAGLIARWRHSTMLGIGAGIAIGFVFSHLAAMGQPDHYLEIVLPGMLVGAIAGFVTQRYPKAAIATGALVVGAAVAALVLATAAQLVFVGTSGTLSNVGVLLTQLRYTRVAEREADVHALRMLMAAGISAKGFGEFFERLEGKRPAGGGSGPRFSEIEVIRTHPLTADRIAMVRAQPAYDATPALSADDWRALQRACGPAAAEPPPQQSGQEQVSRPDVPAKQSPSKDARKDARKDAPQDAAKEGSAETDRDIAAATKTLEANPGDVAALQKRARAYATRNKHADALADYVKASQLKPQDAGLHYGRGLALHSLRRYEEALAAYDEALRLSANYAAARNGRGNANRALKRYDAALLDFDELLKTQPSYAHGHYNRGLVHREMERPEDAIRDFDATLVRDKEYTAAYTSRGMTHEKTGARDKAIADFRAALAAPAKYSNGAWAHRTARERLKALGVSDP